MRKTTEKLFNDIYASGKLSRLALAVTAAAFLVDFLTMQPTNQALLEFSATMVFVVTVGMALAMEASPNVLALLLKKKEKIPMDYLLMVLSAGIFLLVSGLNLIVKLGSMDLIYSDANKGSYLQTVVGSAAEPFKATDGQIAMTVIQALVPVMTSVLVFIIGIAQDTALLEQKKRHAFLKAAREDLGRIDGQIAALEQEPGPDIAADMVREYFNEAYGALDTICFQLKREAAHLIASRVRDREEAFSYLQNRRKGSEPGPEDGGGSVPDEEDIPYDSLVDTPEDFYEAFEQEASNPDFRDFEGKNMEDFREEREERGSESADDDTSGKASEERYSDSFKGRPFRVVRGRYPD